MADPKLSAAQVAKLVSGVSSQIDSALKAAVTDAYRLGYTDGDRDAIARVLQAASPYASGRTADEKVPTNDAPGAATHQLITVVLQATSTGKASPVEIERSPVNSKRITRAAINKALKRGAKNGVYVNDGSGQYSLAKTGGWK